MAPMASMSSDRPDLTNQTPQGRYAGWTKIKIGTNVKDLAVAGKRCLDSLVQRRPIHFTEPIYDNNDEEEQEQEKQGDQQEELLQVQEANKRRVTLIKVVFLKIEDINTVNECFSGTFFLKAKWREPALDSVISKLDSGVNWSNLWNPQLDIYNVLGSSTVQVWNDVEFGPNGQAFAVEKRRVNGTFTEKMELMEFPFDVQDLSLLVTSDIPEDEITLQEDADDPSNVVTHSFVDESQWHLKQFVQSEQRVTNDKFVNKRYRKPGMFFRCCVIRRAGFFVWNIMLVMSIISALSFVTFAVHRNLPQNRLQMSFILVLAGVTFKFAASDSVPKISYLTHLDRYIIGSMVFLFLVTIWHGVVSQFDDDASKDMDFSAFIGFIILYVTLHTAFIIYAVVQGLAKRKEINKIEKGYLERLKKVHYKVNSNDDSSKERLKYKRWNSVSLSQRASNA